MVGTRKRTLCVPVELSTAMARRFMLTVLTAMLITLAAPVSTQESVSTESTINAHSAIPLSFESTIKAALASSSTISNLRKMLADQLEDIGIVSYLDDIRLSVAGAIGGNPSTPFTYSGDAELSATVELIPQLSVNGNLYAGLSAPDADGLTPWFDPLAGSLGLTFTPLADTTAPSSKRLEIERTRLDITTAVRQVSFTAVTELLNAVSAGMEVILNEQKLSVAEGIMEVTQILYAKELATEEQYDNAVQSVRSARRSLLSSRLTAEKAMESLAQTMDMPVDTVIIPEFSQLDLDSISADAATLPALIDIHIMADESTAVCSARLDVTAAEIDLAGARVFSPSLIISAGTELPDLDYSVSAEFSVAVSDFDLQARNNAADNLTDARKSYEYTRRLVRFDVRSKLLELEFALDDIKVTVKDLAESKQDLAETRLFLARGEVTELALAQAELNVLTAENSLACAELQVTNVWFAIRFGQYE